MPLPWVIQNLSDFSTKSARTVALLSELVETSHRSKQRQLANAALNLARRNAPVIFPYLKEPAQIAHIPAGRWDIVEDLLATGDWEIRPYVRELVANPGWEFPPDGCSSYLKHLP